VYRQETEKYTQVLNKQQSKKDKERANMVKTLQKGEALQTYSEMTKNSANPFLLLYFDTRICQ